MQTVCLHDKEELEAFLRHNSFLHIYAIGDLDDVFWPHTTWYALRNDRRIQEVVLLYFGTDPVTLLALTDEPPDAMRTLLRSITHLLPIKFYAHLSQAVVAAFGEDYLVRSHGMHYKMALTNPGQLDEVDTSEVLPMTMADVADLRELYSISYPGNWFDPRMLETGCYYGIRRDQRIVCVAGTHVVSRRYRVAALGNIATYPACRGQGLARAACARLCLSLLPDASHIGMNVKADNRAAIACYEKLGFVRMASYEECEVQAR